MTLPIPTDLPFAVGPLFGGSLRLLWPQRAPLLRAMALPLALILLLSLTHDSAPLETGARGSELGRARRRGRWGSSFSS